MIAKCDTTANDVPVQIQGFPTLILFKADTNEEIPYDGDRSLDSLIAFLKENAANGKDIKVESDAASAPADSDEDEGGEL